LIEKQVRNAAYRIIDGKGATYYGIGSAITRIVEIILGNQRSILTVCTPIDEFSGLEDVTLALPNLIGGEGILETLTPSVNKAEEEALMESATVIHNAIQFLLKENI
jgi:L-lactate dehydrogenase